MARQQAVPTVAPTLQPERAIPILENLISQADSLGNEQSDSTKRQQWAHTGEGALLFHKMFPLHPSPTEISKGRLTPSSRRRLGRHHLHLLCRRFRLPLRLARPALVEGRDRRLPTDHEGSPRSIVGIFCSCPHGTLCLSARAAGVSCGRWHVDRLRLKLSEKQNAAPV